MFEFFTKLKSDRGGFTLIELLVVISIIGVLSGMVLVGMTGVRGKARDARRVSDIRQIRTAVEMYAAEHGSYPGTSGQIVCLGVPSTEECWGGGPRGNDSVNAALAAYIKQVPKDPLYGASSRVYGTYIYASPGSYWLPAPVNTVNGAYTLAFQTEKFPNNDKDCLGWTWGAWESRSPATHCPPGGSCRQCGYLGR
jgi:prepilin-type N-terminal cleavage/methylation domain